MIYVQWWAGLVTVLSWHDLDNTLIMFTQTGQEFGFRVHNTHIYSMYYEPLLLFGSWQLHTIFAPDHQIRIMNLSVW